MSVFLGEDAVRVTISTRRGEVDELDALGVFSPGYGGDERGCNSQDCRDVPHDRGGCSLFETWTMARVVVQYACCVSQARRRPELKCGRVAVIALTVQ